MLLGGLLIGIISITSQVRTTEALNITFPLLPHAGRGSTILWKREDSDPKEVWLRKRYLSGTPGIAPWVAENVHLNLTLPSGVDSINFARSGVYDVGIFDKPDNPPSQGQFTLQPIGIVEVTVSEAVNSTPSTPGVIQTVTVSKSFLPTTTGAKGQLPPGQNDPKTHKLSNGAIAGIVVGALILVLIPILVLCLRSRRARAERDEAIYHRFHLPIPFVQTSPSRGAGVTKGVGLSEQSPGGHDLTEDDDPIAPRVTRHEPVQHEDSGWRPPASESGPNELPPTYRDSTRKIGDVRIGKRSDFPQGVTENCSSPIYSSLIEKPYPEKITANNNR